MGSWRVVAKPLERAWRGRWPSAEIADNCAHRYRTAVRGTGAGARIHYLMELARRLVDLAGSRLLLCDKSLSSSGLPDARTRALL